MLPKRFWVFQNTFIYKEKSGEIKSSMENVASMIFILGLYFGTFHFGISIMLLSWRKKIRYVILSNNFFWLLLGYPMANFGLLLRGAASHIWCWSVCMTILPKGHQKPHSKVWSQGPTNHLLVWSGILPILNDLTH